MHYSCKRRRKSAYDGAPLGISEEIVLVIHSNVAVIGQVEMHHQ